MMPDDVGFDAREPGGHLMGASTDATNDDERAARPDVRGPFEMIEIVIGECAAWRAHERAENPTVAQARVMARHGDAVEAMVTMWAATGRPPYRYRYDGTADEIQWNIPEAGTGWFVFGHDAPGATRHAPWRRRRR